MNLIILMLIIAIVAVIWVAIVKAVLNYLNSPARSDYEKNQRKLNKRKWHKVLRDIWLWLKDKRNKRHLAKSQAKEKKISQRDWMKNNRPEVLK